ncbi:Outer membrane protein TolC [Bryocella elongata]|uniref:Outer membrane protein TolC n=1 Tax=Bryocella elongata TaxID=863522 RepID=A0A1H5VV50_9BACT|nr:TolC family protein [Bryocella elongata]SEF90427.1 Outer membrane protein TolC [Bryocella elongata]
MTIYGAKRIPEISRRLLPLILMAPLLQHAAFDAEAQTTALPAATAHVARPTLQLTLPKALELAAQHNRRLQASDLATREAEQKKLIARSDYAPHIRNESSAVYISALEGVVIPAGAFANSATTGTVPSQTLKIGQGAQEGFTSGTGLVQPITQLLTVHAGVRAATADVNIAKLNTQDSQNSVALLVHKLYFAMLTAQMQRDAAQSAVDAGAIEEEESKRSVAEGRSLPVVELQTHAALLAAKQSNLTLELELSDLNEQFNDVLGLSFGTKLILDPNELGEAPTLPTEEEAIRAANTSNPKILAGRQAVEKAHAGVTAAKDAYIPNVSGMARYSYQSGIPFLVHNFGTFGGLVSYDLFDGGAREARLKAARIQLSQAQLQLSQAEADLSVEVNAQYDEIEKLTELVNVATEMLAVKQEAARVSAVRLQQSAALDTETARANAEVAAAQATLLQTRLNLRLTQNQLLETLGLRPQ